MPSIPQTGFEVKVTNMQYNATQNVAGVFHNASDALEACPSGFLCTRKKLLPNSGYAGVNNGNAWIMEAAASGAPSATGTVPKIYAFNSYDVNRVAQGTNSWMVGAQTFGLELPADGTPGTFTEIIEGEQYVFGSGNFSTAPTDVTTTIYATIANGLLVASATAPAAGVGFWFEITAKVNITTGTRNWGDAYRVIARYNGPAAAAG